MILWSKLFNAPHFHPFSDVPNLNPPSVHLQNAVPVQVTKRNHNLGVWAATASVRPNGITRGGAGAGLVGCGFAEINVVEGVLKSFRDGMVSL